MKKLCQSCNWFRNMAIPDPCDKCVNYSQWSGTFKAVAKHQQNRKRITQKTKGLDINLDKKHQQKREVKE